MTFTIHLGWWFIPLCITVFSVIGMHLKLVITKQPSEIELFLYMPVALIIGMISWIIAGALK